MGRQVHAHPAMIIVSFLVLGMLLNPIVGALLAVPTAVFVETSMDQLTSEKPSLGYEETEHGTE
jgi:predicted PurR-regulated permease PerM